MAKTEKSTQGDKDKKAYVPPVLECVTVIVEKGFALSKKNMQQPEDHDLDLF